MWERMGVLVLGMILLSSCAGRQGEVSLPDQAERLPATLIAREVDLLAYIGSRGLTEHSEFDMDYIRLTPAAPGEAAWVIYGAQPPAGERLYEFNIDVDDADIEDEEWVPDLPWWVGYANHTSGRWEWSGPYTDFMAQPQVNNELPREAYVNDEGFAYWVILSYCPPDEAAATMSLLMMDMVTTDSAPGEPPY